MKKALLFCAAVLLSSAAFATPPNTPVLDGQPIEYDTTDLRGSFQGASSWGANGTLSNLFVTWDAEYLYVALQAWQADNNKLVVLLDVDPGAGTGATTTANWTSIEPSFIKYNDYGWVSASGFGLDYMLASEGTYNNVIRVNYDGAVTPSTNNMESLFDQGNSGTPVGSPIDMAARNDATACPHKGFETRIPWAVLYEGTRWGTVEAGETVPRGAILRVLAGIHNNDPASAWSSPDTIPNQAVTNHVNGILTTATYLDVILDSDNDGLPDLLAGDVNAPYIRTATGAVGSPSIYVGFNEPVTVASVENKANWSVGGVVPVTAAAQGQDGVLLTLPAPVASTDLLLIRAAGVEDASANSRTTEFCLYPAANAIPTAVEVTFQVNTNSGMGLFTPRPDAFFINGSALPLEWGYPPAEIVSLAPLPGSNGWAYATVTFPPGTPATIYYKYSGRIDGTNNYEAIRLTDFADASRPLALNTNGMPITVVDYLGAVAHPLRNPGDTNLPSAQNQLFKDPRRGDAGVRVRREILFQLDLSLRRRDNLARVMVLGSDPLRGFNSNGDDEGGTASDYPDNSAYVDWDTAGIELVDDGTLGDDTPGDGIYSRLWAFSTDGYDAAIEPNSPYSLVGGATAVYYPEEIPGTEPYLGDTYWIARRSPRSMVYKFYVLTTGDNHYESPGSNLNYYVVDPEDTAQIVLAPHVWDNDAIPPPPPSNAPTMTDVSIAGTIATVLFENVPNEGAHGVKISTNLLNGFDNYGHRAIIGEVVGDKRQWSASIAEASPLREFYAAYAGLEPTPTPTYWEPNANIPIGATTVRVYFCQFQSNISGMRTMHLTGTFRPAPGWDEGLPMTFIGNGTWMIDLALPAATDGSGVKFKPRGGPTYVWYETGGDFQFVRGTGGVTMTPMPPVPGELFTITLDAAGTPLATATNIDLHMGFDNWQDVQESPRPAMTNTDGTVWEYSFAVSTNYSVSIDWVFTGYPNGSTNQTWYSDFNWHAFMAPYYNAP
ncbi:MAG: hypothetical protein KBC66_05320 [Kiritimatiellae bacterium]|nr:hypothetical protein [Kiritimatiellia bacterium]